MSEPFKNLFTQGMVCHETYQDKDGHWVYPEEVEKLSVNKAIKKKIKASLKLVPLSLCQNLKKIL